MLFKAGDEISQFRATTLQGRPFSYREIWQRRNLVLIAVPGAGSTETAARVADWASAAARTSGDDTQWVITSDSVAGVGRPGVVVADKWGEIHFAQSAPSVADLPGGDELVEWVDFVRYQCPECQGEAK